VTALTAASISLATSCRKPQAESTSFDIAFLTIYPPVLSFFPRMAHSALAGLYPHTVPYLLFTGHPLIRLRCYVSLPPVLCLFYFCMSRVTNYPLCLVVRLWLVGFNVGEPG
jgi:hypothetical protein